MQERVRTWDSTDSTMSPTGELIQKLLRLATNNPNEEEARSAALKLCKLLVQHKAQIVLPASGSQQQPQQPQRPPTGYGYPSQQDMKDFWEQIRVAQQEAANRQREQAAARARDIEELKRQAREETWRYANMYGGQAWNPTPKPPEPPDPPKPAPDPNYDRDTGRKVT